VSKTVDAGFPIQSSDLKIPLDFRRTSVSDRGLPQAEAREPYYHKRPTTGWARDDVAPECLRLCSSDQPGAAAPDSGSRCCAIALYGDCILHRSHYRNWRRRWPGCRGRRPRGITSRNRHSHHRSCAVRRYLPRPRHWRSGTQPARRPLCSRLRGGAAIWSPVRSRARDSRHAVRANCGFMSFSETRRPAIHALHKPRTEHRETSLPIVVAQFEVNKPTSR
jgi:hypothetical protein